MSNHPRTPASRDPPGSAEERLVNIRALTFSVVDPNSMAITDVLANDIHVEGQLGEMGDDNTNSFTTRLRPILQHRRSPPLNCTHHEAIIKQHIPHDYDSIFGPLSDIEDESTYEASRREMEHYTRIALLEHDKDGFNKGKPGYFSTLFLDSLAAELRRRNYNLTWQLQRGQAWPFHLTVNVIPASGAPSVDGLHRLTRYLPHSDFTICAEGFPYIIVEVISQPNESDRNRMLLHAGCLVRIASDWWPKRSSDRFTLMAIYIDSQFQAERFLLSQADTGRRVKYVTDTFDLKKQGDGIKFLRELHNFGLVIKKSIEEFGQEMRTKLDGLNELVPNTLPALFSTATLNEMKKRKRSGKEGGGNKSNRSRNQDPNRIDELLGELSDKGYEFQPSHDSNGTWNPWTQGGSPSVIKAKSKKYGSVVLKRVDEAEETIHKILAGTADPSNHTIPLWEVERLKGGTVLVMPFAEPLSGLDPRGFTSDLARQLLEGIGFMHQQGFVHLDLKPENLVLDGQRLLVIDFGLARSFYRGQLLSGFRGTRGWVAPEVMKGERFDPVKADLWAVGNIINDFIQKAESRVCYGGIEGSGRSGSMESMESGESGESTESTESTGSTGSIAIWRSRESRWVRSIASNLMDDDPRRRRLDLDLAMSDAGTYGRKRAYESAMGEELAKRVHADESHAVIY